MESGPGATKREFLVGAGGFAAASLVASQPANGQAGKRKLGYALVGLGVYARIIARRFADCEHAELKGLVSGSPEKARAWAAEYGVPEKNLYTYSNFDSIRDNPDIDIVYVILPNSMHAEYTIRAARAGKHVMCEKPMAVSARECEQMIAACKAANVRLMIGYRSHFEPYNRLAIELARTEAAGRTRMIHAEHGFPIPAGVWRLDRKLAGGGSLMDIGIYSLQAARYLAGEEPVSVMAIESTDRSDPRFAQAGVEDRLAFDLLFPSGTIASCVSSYSSNHNRYRVVGDKGWFELEPATSYGGQAMRTRIGNTTEPRVIQDPGKNQFAGQLDHLAECIKAGREPIVSGEEGLRDLRIMEAIYQSVRERRAVPLGARA